MALEIHKKPFSGVITSSRSACFANLVRGLQSLLRVILGLDPRIHLFNGLRVIMSTLGPGTSGKPKAGPQCEPALVINQPKISWPE